MASKTKVKKPVFALLLTNGAHSLNVLSTELPSGLVEGFGGSTVFNFPKTAEVTIDGVFIMVPFQNWIQVPVPATYVFLAVTPESLE